MGGLEVTPEEIKEIRKMYGMSQEKFARIIGSTVVTINRWERGHAKPSKIYIKQLKQAKANHGSYASRRKQSQKS